MVLIIIPVIQCYPDKVTISLHQTKSAAVTRPDGITIRYQDERFQTLTTTFQGMNARIIQHEYDHIEGKLYLDHLSPLNRTLLRHKLQQASRGKFRPSYPMQFPVRN
jgi:peptide deformylase